MQPWESWAKGKGDFMHWIHKLHWLEIKKKFLIYERKKPYEKDPAVEFLQ